MKNLKKYWWIVVIVVAALTSVAYIKVSNKKLGPSSSASPSPSVSTSPAVKKPASSGGSAQTAPKTYDQLVDEYKDRRIQFDQNCQATPNSITYNNETKIMLDNRSAQPAKVTVGGTSYSLIGYGWQLVTLSSKTLPKELQIDCGRAVNVGKILLQALILP